MIWVSRTQQWDDRMATLAQRWADKCKFEPGFPPDAGSRIFGQNMFLTKNIDVVNGQEAVRTWFKEKVHYDMEKGTCQPDRMCSNYTQASSSCFSKSIFRAFWDVIETPFIP